MNKALDLLRRLASGDNRGDFFISNELLKEIQELLAQPEQTKQEPVVWQVIGIAGFMYVYNKPIDQVYEHHTVNALYTAPPKREPLSDLRIGTANRNDYFEWGVRFAEKAHGITGGGE